MMLNDGSEDINSPDPYQAGPYEDISGMEAFRQTMQNIVDCITTAYIHLVRKAIEVVLQRTKATEPVTKMIILIMVMRAALEKAIECGRFLGWGSWETSKLIYDELKSRMALPSPASSELARILREQEERNWAGN